MEIQYISFLHIPFCKVFGTVGAPRKYNTPICNNLKSVFEK